MNIKDVEYLNIWGIRIEARFGRIQFVNLFHRRIGRLAHTSGSNDAPLAGSRFVNMQRCPNILIQKLVQKYYFVMGNICFKCWSEIEFRIVKS